MSAVAEKRERAQLRLEGMTCASCAARIERKLNKLEGVQANVNYATDEAAVSYDAARVSLDDLIRAVEGAGYRAAPSEEGVEEIDPLRELRIRLIAAAVLTLPLVALAMI